MYNFYQHQLLLLVNSRVYFVLFSPYSIMGGEKSAPTSIHWPATTAGPAVTTTILSGCSNSRAARFTWARDT
jgi:hypothetical protein